jgi:serine/threonine protein kinase/tetratricopeptide (TPR) repeat protein
MTAGRHMATIAGRYEITAKLGEGGMGVVFRAYDPPPLDREVAVKTLHEFTDPLALELFYKECSALKSISHPNIVEIFDMGEFDDEGHRKPFFVMPLLPGQTLDQLIKRSSHRLTVDRVVEIFAQTCRGLQAAHERGLVHRDLKPSNIFVMADDSVKIIDFGVAHAVSAQSRTLGFDKGTLLYMAPEQVQHKPVSPQSDIYALGVTLYEALTRRQPFRGATEEAVIQSILSLIPPPASDLNPAVSQVVSRVVHKAMAKQPWNRFDTAREFGDTLQRAARNEAIEIFDPSRTQPRIQTAAKALERGDYQFAGEIVGELEAEGNIDPQITLLRTQVDQISRQRTIAQLLDSAKARFEENEDPLALSKLQEVLNLDPTNVLALSLKSKIDDRRSDRQIEKWIQLAQQHVNNHSYGHAREALQNALNLRPKDSRASRLLKAIELEEQEYVRLRQEKVAIYQAAVNAWKNGEVSQALSRMRLVLDLDHKAPDVTAPDASGAYQAFYDKIRVEHDAINSAYAEARRHLDDRRFARALTICQQYLERYSGHALFQSLKFDIEEQQRQQLSAYIADVERRLDSEADLDAKVHLVREAVAEYPQEEHFRRLATVLEDKRNLVNSIVERARVHEAAGQITEALGDLETLRTIYGTYPGLAFERDRLQKRLEQQTRDAARTRWVRQVDGQLEAGNFARADELLDMAQAEFADDTELVELRGLAKQGKERTARADELVAEGQQLCARGQFEQGVDLLKIALELDDRTGVRQVLRDLFVARAQESLNSDWRAVEAFADRALELDANHALARSLRAQALDRKREEEIPQLASQARRLQAAGDFAGALAEVEKGLASYPGDGRLSAIAEALRKELRRATQAPAPASDAERTRLLTDRRATQAPVAPSAPEVEDIRPAPAAPITEPIPAPAPSPIEAPRRVPWKLIAGAAAVLVVAIVALLGRQSIPEPQSASPASEVQPPAPVPLPATPAPEPQAAPALVALTLERMPPGVQVSLDGTSIGSVGADGSLSHPGVSPGPHKLTFVRSGYEPLTIEKTFIGPDAVALTVSDVPLKRMAAGLELLADTGTQLTISQNGRTIQRVNGASKLSIPEGTYSVEATGPAGVPIVRTVSVTSGATQTVDLRPLIVSGMELFDLSAWKRDENWFTRRGGGFALYNRTIADGRYTFTVRLDRNGNPFSTSSRLKWVVGFVDNNTHVMLQLDKDAFYRLDVVGGSSQQVRIPHRIPTNVPFVHLNLQISGARLIHQYSIDGSNWQELDSWTRTPSGPDGNRRTPLDGRFGFFLLPDEEVFVSNFLNHPEQ